MGKQIGVDGWIYFGVTKELTRSQYFANKHHRRLHKLIAATISCGVSFGGNLGGQLNVIKIMVLTFEADSAANGVL